MILTAGEELQVREFEAHYKLWGPQRRQAWRYYDGPDEFYRLTYPNAPYPSIPTPADNKIWGVDMSGYWNGVADWNKARDTGCKFAIIKACDGTVLTKNFYANVEGALKAGLVVGAYYWLYRNVRVSGNAQANAWWNATKGLGLKIHMVDLEWTYWNGAPDNPTTPDLYGVVIPFENLSGQKMMIYSAPGYLSTYFNHDPMWAAYPLCIAHYGVLQPASVAPWGNNWKMWQLTDRWPGLPLGLDPAVSTASDGDLYNGTQEQFEVEYGLVEEPPSEPEAYTVKRSLSEYALDTTPETWDPQQGLPLISSVTAAAQYGWDAAMNGGAGFDYNADYTGGIPRTSGFTYFVRDGKQFYFARRVIDQSVINPNLSDNPNRGPWCLVWFDAAGNAGLTVTTGYEPNGKTQLEAAQYVKSLGAMEAYLVDSGHSAQIEENGLMWYWPYAPQEKVPQHIGFKKKSGGGTSMTTKGVCKAGLNANIKTMADGIVRARMAAGDYVYGDDSNPPTDIINFTHFYRADGTKFDLSVYGPCKVSRTNLTVYPNTPEPGDIPNPPPTGVPHYYAKLTDADGKMWVIDTDFTPQ